MIGREADNSGATRGLRQCGMKLSENGRPLGRGAMMGDGKPVGPGRSSPNHARTCPRARSGAGATPGTSAKQDRPAAQAVPPQRPWSSGWRCGRADRHRPMLPCRSPSSAASVQCGLRDALSVRFGTQVPTTDWIGATLPLTDGGMARGWGTAVATLGYMACRPARGAEQVARFGTLANETDAPGSGFPCPLGPRIF